MADAPVSFPGYANVELWRQGSVTCSYRAVQESIGRRVFIKALNTHVLPNSPFAQALEREAQVLARLRHKSFPQIYDFVKTEGRMWLVLEGIEGWTLKEVLDRTRGLGADVAAAVALQVAVALEQLHDSQVIHSDLQPHNIFLTPRGEVCLFGFSSALLPEGQEVPELLEGEDGVVAPFYKSPEQILGERLSPATDIYSVGTILYEMLAGRRPFEAPEVRTVSQKIRNEAAASLQEVAVGTPGSLQRVVQRCMEKLAADRFFSARELVTALSQSVSSSPRTLRNLTREALLAAGFAGASVGEHRATLPPPPPARRLRLDNMLAVYGVCLGLVLVGGAAIQLWLAQPSGQSAHARRLELLPEKPAQLRVVADPWAHVVVDGERVETTPFAQSIPLRAGTHYVQLEHPNAPAIQRTVELAAGEVVLLDVKMEVPPPPAPPIPARKPSAAEAAESASP